VADVDHVKLLKQHQNSGKIATLTAIQSGGRFVMLEVNASDTVECFKEESIEDGAMVVSWFYNWKSLIYQG